MCVNPVIVNPIMLCRHLIYEEIIIIHSHSDLIVSINITFDLDFLYNIIR